METERHDPVMLAFEAYISAFPFQRRFEQFFIDHALTFTDDEEHHLEYMSTYIQFQHLFNEEMEDFLETQNMTETEFAEICKKSIESDARTNEYLEVVLASMDYPAFCNLMRAMRGRAKLDQDMKRAEAKEEKAEASITTIPVDRKATKQSGSIDAGNDDRKDAKHINRDHKDTKNSPAGRDSK